MGPGGPTWGRGDRETGRTENQPRRCRLVNGPRGVAGVFERNFFFAAPEPEETPEVGSDENPEKEETVQSEVKAPDDDSTEDESDREEDESAPSKKE